MGPPTRRAQQVVALLTHTVVDPPDPSFGAPPRRRSPPPVLWRSPRSRAAAGAAASPRGSRCGWSSSTRSGRSSTPAASPSLGPGRDRVVHPEDGRREGVEAVIDKDFASAVLAGAIGADLPCITTGVDRVAVDFGTPDQRALDAVSVEEARRQLPDWQFPPRRHGAEDPGGARVRRRRRQRGAHREPDRRAGALPGETGTRIAAVVHAVP
jgi:carbamate kinase